MNLMDDEINNTKVNKTDKTSKASKIILILIILLVIGIISILMIMPLLKETKLSVKLDGQENANLKNILQIQEDGQVYVPIRDIAKLLGYEDYSGNYFNKSENTDECYVETENEVATFKADSKKIEKINKSTSKVTYFLADEETVLSEGKLYTTMDGIEKAFNVSFSYNSADKKVSVYTMDNLITSYSNKTLKLGYKEVSSQFEDKKSILNGLLIVIDNKNKYGVLSVETNELVLEPKYDKIEYIPIFGDFLIQSNEKYGIVTIEGKEKIKLQYDAIQLIDQDSKLYIVKNGNKYGVIDQDEKVIIPVSCDSLGVSSKSFNNQDIKNNYILFDKIIPVKANNLWALYDVQGNRLTNFVYSSFGNTNSKVQNASSLLLVPDYNVLIGSKNKKYVLINENGQELLNGMEFEDAYMITDYNKTDYYVVRNEKTYNLLDLLEELNNR